MVQRGRSEEQVKDKEPTAEELRSQLATLCAEAAKGFDGVVLSYDGLGPKSAEVAQQLSKRYEHLSVNVVYRRGGAQIMATPVSPGNNSPHCDAYYLKQDADKGVALWPSFAEVVGWAAGYNACLREKEEEISRLKRELEDKERYGSKFGMPMFPSMFPYPFCR